MSISDNLMAWAQFASRIALSTLYLSTGGYYILHGQFTAHAGTFLYRHSAILDLKLTLLSGLLCTAAIWLLFGVRSRVMAAMGCIGFMAISLGSELVVGMPFAPVEVLFAFMLSIPIIAGGGGKFALYRRGWRDIV
jgi:hypothetical protein